MEEYNTIDEFGNERVLEWYEGSGFKWCNEGHWSDENGNIIKNIIKWQVLE